MELGADGWRRLHNRRVDVELLEVEKPSTVQIIGHGARFHCPMTARPFLKVREEGHEPGLCPTQPLQDPDELPTIPPYKAGLACCLGHTISDVYPSIAQQSLEPV